MEELKKMNTFSNEMYVPFTDSLFPAEEQFLSTILSGADKEISLAIKWLNSHEGKRLLNSSPSQLEELWDESDFKIKLNNLIQGNSKRIDSHISNFYRNGMNIGFSDINKTFKSTSADSESLDILLDYNERLVRSFDDEVAYGIKDAILGGIENGLVIPALVHELVGLPYKPLDIEYMHPQTSELVTPIISPRTRAEMITRTEYARAVNNGTLQAYANYGVSEVDIVTAGDGFVCDLCADVEANNPYSILEVGNILQVHPNCRCGVRAIINSSNYSDEIMVVSLVD